MEFGGGFLHLRRPFKRTEGERSERFSSLSASVWVCWAVGQCVPLIWASDVRQQLLGLSWGCQKIFSIKYSQKTDGDISFLQHPPSCHEQRKIFPSPARRADRVCCKYCTYSMDKCELELFQSFSFCHFCRLGIPFKATTPKTFLSLQRCYLSLADIEIQKNHFCVLPTRHLGQVGGTESLFLGIVRLPGGEVREKKNISFFRWRSRE